MRHAMLAKQPYGLNNPDHTVGRLAGKLVFKKVIDGNIYVFLTHSGGAQNGFAEVFQLGDGDEGHEFIYQLCLYGGESLYLIQMESWQDQGIVLSTRPHGESGAVVSLLTRHQGRHAGYVRGARSTRMRGTLEAGNLVDANWRARNEDDLGTLSLELSRSPSSHFMQEPLKLAALQSACALSDEALPEREGHSGLFHGLEALLETLQTDFWAPAYVMWEVAFLKELGFSLDITKCAGGGDAGTLAYISPKTGRAVSLAEGEPYKDKLLPLPGFLKPSGGASNDEEVLTGLGLTGYFLEHWVFAHHTKGVPEARLRFFDRFEKAI